MSAQILKALGLAQHNSGSYLGNGEWSKTADAGLVQSVNPSTNDVIAEVHASSASDYETMIDPRLVCEPGEAAKYEPVRCGDYVLGRFDAAFAYRKAQATAQ